MAKTNVTITLDNDITISPEYRKLVSTRQLSEQVNTILRAALQISKYEVPAEEADMDNELQSLAIKTALIKQKKEELRKEAEEKRKNRRVVAGGWT
jgi:hypothetical protein